MWLTPEAAAGQLVLCACRKHVFWGWLPSLPALAGEPQARPQARAQEGSPFPFPPLTLHLLHPAAPLLPGRSRVAFSPRFFPSACLCWAGESQPVNDTQFECMLRLLSTVNQDEILSLLLEAKRMLLIDEQQAFSARGCGVA